MDFPTSLKFLHIFAVAISGGGLLVFMREAGFTAFDVSPVDGNVHRPSTVMMVGVFLLCLSIGGLLAFSFFLTAKLPATSLMVARVISLTGLCLSSIALHLYVRPLFDSKHDFDDRPLADLVGASLLASVATTCWLLWIGAGIAPDEIASIGIGSLLQALMLICTFLTLAMTSVLITAALMTGYVTEPRATSPVLQSAYVPARPAPRRRAEPAFSSYYSEAQLHAAQ